MYLNLIKSLAIILICIASVSPFVLLDLKCQSEGSLSFDQGNLKCSVPLDIDDERCARLFLKGCQIAKTNKICKQGADYVLDNRTKIDCSILKQDTSYETQLFQLCCEACQNGLNKFKNNESCQTIALDSDKDEYYISNEIERCCNLGENKLNNCEKLKCEHSCVMNNSIENCICNNGYRLNDNGLNCDDIDECNDLNLNKCSSDQTCVNLKGSYECSKTVGRIPRSESNSEIGDFNEEENDKKIENTTTLFEDNLNTNQDLINHIQNFVPNEQSTTTIKSDAAISKFNQNISNSEIFLKSNSNLLNSQINLIISLCAFHLFKRILV